MLTLFPVVLSVDDDGPPLSNTDVKNLVILTELPFVVSFEERVKVKHILQTIHVQKVVTLPLFMSIHLNLFVWWSLTNNRMHMWTVIMILKIVFKTNIYIV